MRVDFAFRLICAVLICAVVMLITTLLGPARAVAAEPGMPPIDFLVYLDNSSTVFTGAPDAPNKRLVGMLETVFQQPIENGQRTFVRHGDRVYPFTFGSSVIPLTPGVDGGDTVALRNTLARFGDTVKADKTTEFDKLMRAIAGNEVLKNRTDGRLKIVLIASDFIHDASDTAHNKEHTGVCDVLNAFKKSQQIPVAGDIATVRSTLIDGRALPPVFGLLAIRPTAADFQKSRKDYRDCVMEVVRLRPLIQGLEHDLGATTIEYDDAKKDASLFTNKVVQMVMRATLPPLTIEQASCRPRGAEEASCTVRVRNPGQVPNVLKSITFRVGEQSFTKLTDAASVAAGEAKAFELTLAGPEAWLALKGAPRVTVEDDAKGTGGSLPVSVSEVAPLVIENPTAARESAQSPYILTFDLINKGDTAKTPRELIFHDPNGDRAFAVHQDLKREPLGPGQKAEKISVAIPPAAAGRLAKLNVSVLSREDDGVTERLSPDASITTIEEKSLEVDSAEVTALPEGGLSLSASIDNPSGRSNAITELGIFGAADATGPLQTQAMNTVVGPSGTISVAMLLGESVSEALRNGNDSLQVAVTDKQTGRRSALHPVNQRSSGTENKVVPTLCRWKKLNPNQPSEAEIFLICDVQNKGLFKATVTGLLIQDGAASGRRFFATSVEVKPGPPVPVTVVLPVESWLRKGPFTVRTTIVGAQPSDPLERVASPFTSNQRLVVSGAMFISTSSKATLNFSVKNNANAALRLTKYRLCKVSDGPDGCHEYDVIDKSKMISAESREPMQFSFDFPETQWSKNDPHVDQKLIVIDSLHDNDEELPEGVQVIPLPTIPLELDGEAVWRDGATMLVRVKNEGSSSQGVKSVWLGHSRDQWEQHIEPDPPVIVSGNGDTKSAEQVHDLTIPFNEDMQKTYLMGKSLWLCLVTEDLPPPEGGAVCHGAPREYQLNAERQALEFRTTDPVALAMPLNLQIRNPGLLPNKVTGINLHTSDGNQILDTEPLPEPVFVAAGGQTDFSLQLSPGAISKIYGKEKEVLIGLQDLRPVEKTLPRDWIKRAKKIQVTKYSYDADKNGFIIQSVPGAKPYIIVRGNVVITKNLNLPLPITLFHIGLISADGTLREPALDARVDFTGLTATVPTIWRFKNNDPSYTSSSIQIKSDLLKENNNNKFLIGTNTSINYKFWVIILIIVMAIGVVVGWAVQHHEGLSGWLPSVTSSKDVFNNLGIIAKNISRAIDIMKGLIATSTVAIVTVIFNVLTLDSWIIDIFALTIFVTLGIAVVMMPRYILVTHVSFGGTKPLEMPWLIRRSYWIGLGLVVVMAGVAGGVLYHFNDLVTPYSHRDGDCFVDFSKPEAGQAPGPIQCTIGAPS